MKIRAILETETMDPDFREPFLNGMPFDITESTFDRIVRYASGCTDVQQPDVIAMVIQHSLENRKELSELLDRCNNTTQMRILIPVPISAITLTSSKNQKLFTLSPKILSVFSNPLSNENQTYNPNINCHGSSSHGIPYQ